MAGSLTGTIVININTQFGGTGTERRSFTTSLTFGTRLRLWVRGFALRIEQLPNIVLKLLVNFGTIICSMYSYATVTALKYGQRKIETTGHTLNSVVLRERNLLVYTNIITKKKHVG